MTLYILTCVDDEYKLVSVDVFKDKRSAEMEMKKQFEIQKQEYRENGYKDSYDSLCHDSAELWVSNYIYGCVWNITEKEIEL